MSWDEKMARVTNSATLAELAIWKRLCDDATQTYFHDIGSVNGLCDELANLLGLPPN